MKTVRRPPYPKWNPGYFPCSSLTPPSAFLTPSIGVLRWIRVKSLADRIREMVEVPDPNDAARELFQLRPKFQLVTSDPSDWLTGEYKVSDLAVGSTRADGEFGSAKRLLRIAKLDLVALRTAPDYLVPDLLRQASDIATERLSKVWLQDNLRVDFQMSTAGIQGIVIYVSSRDHTGLPRQRSYGFRWFLEFLLSYAESQNAKEPSILLFDEPGIHLHPAGQEDLKQLLEREISAGTQVILTTHLPGLVDLTEPHSIRGVVKSEFGTQILNEGYSPDHGKPTWEVMLRAIGVHGPEGFGPGRTLIVEGLSDMQYLLGMAKHLVDHDERAEAIASGIVRSYAAHGAHSIKAVCPHFMKNASVFAVLLDSDNEGYVVSNLLEKRYSPPNEWFREIVQVADLEYPDNYFDSGGSAGQVEHELEDLFGPQLYADMVNSVFWSPGSDVDRFMLDPATVPSKSKKSAQDWLESTGTFDRDEIYRVPAAFSELIAESNISIPQDVADRFGFLLDYLTRATLPPH